jgi:hypothetical protein
MSSSAMTPLADVDWAAAARSLLDDRWCRLAGGLGDELARKLLAAAPAEWHDLDPDEGDSTVYQHGTGAFRFLVDAPALVRRTGETITSALVDAGAPAIPDFNEVSWSHYPQGSGHITAHRDPPGCGGVIATMTLTGRARFHILGAAPSTWETGTGDIVVLAADGWPAAGARCPVHGVEPPPGDDRVIMTYRHNVGGAGAAYFE